MASSYQKLTAEQVRARYHQRFLADDLQPPRIVDALDADGLIHSSKRDAPLKVHIPLWDGRPPFPGAEPMTLTPSMLTIDVQDAAPVTLRATVLKDEPLKWTLRGLGSLDHTGYDATYTPPSTIGEPLLPIEIEVEGLDSGDKVTASIILLNGIFVLPVEPGFHPGLPAQGMAQLRVDDEDFEPAKIRWSVVAGQGHVDSETGEFTAPAQIHSPYTVVQATYGTGLLAKKGYSIIHLSDFARTPRWRTLDFFRLVSDSLTTRVLSMVTAIP